MRYKNFILTLVAVAAFGLLPTAARADGVTFTFVPSSYTASAGSVVTLFGTFTNGTGAITFTGYMESLQAGLSMSPDNSFGSQPFDFLTGLADGETSGPIALFNILIAPGTPDGTVFTFAFNDFTIFYESSTGNEVAVAANFSITVRNQTPGEIPEPISMVLLGTGLVGVAARVRKRRRASKE